MKRMHRIQFATLVLTLLGALAYWATPAQAQKRIIRGMEGEYVEEQTLNDGMMLPNDREARRVIEAAKDYINKKDWDVVARSLQYLLEKPEDSFIEIKKKNVDGKEYSTRISIRIEANRLIGELPADGLEVYRQKYGQTAKGMLEEGLRDNDPYKLSLVAMRYRHTEAGVKAVQTLANYFLDRGNYQSAAGRFLELLELFETEKPEVKKEIGPKTLFKAALAFKRFGDAKNAERFWKEFVALNGDKPIAFGKTSYSVAQLKLEYDRSVQVGSLVLANFHTFRGDATRTAEGIGGEPFLDPRWQFDMIQKGDKDKEENYTEWPRAAKWVEEKISSSMDLIGRNSNLKRAMLPGFFPIAARNKLIVRTYDGVYALAIKDDPADGVKAGEVVWAAQTDNSLFNLAMSPGTRSLLDGWWNSFYVNQGGPHGILFENAQVGSLSHDNSLVYFVDDMALPPHPNQIMQFGWNGQAMMFGSFTDQVLSNTLRAVELDSGRIKWIIGGRNPKFSGKGVNITMPGMPGAPGMPVPLPGAQGQPPVPPKEPKDEKPFVPPVLANQPAFLNAYDELLDCYFLGSPLSIGGLLYVLVESNGEVQLACINPNKTSKSAIKSNEDGPELVWRQPLGNVNTKLMMDALRRVQPAHLSFADGMLICPTNAGVVVAVNILSRSLAWAYSYRASATSPDAGSHGQPGLPPGIRPRRGFEMQQVNVAAERWYVSAPAIVNGKVVFTAHDCNAVQCLSLKDGQVLWSVNRAPKDLYMAGVFGGKVLVVAKDSVRALDLNDGKQIWEKPIGMPSGQGVASNGIYYLPLRQGANSPDPEIVAVQIETGAMHSTKSRKKETPGNLLFYEGDVFSQGVFHVSAYPQLEWKLSEMNRLLKADPKNPKGLTERGELRLDKGELISAIDDFNSALQHDPPAEVRSKARLKLYEAITDLMQKDFNKAEQHLAIYKELCLSDVSGEERLKRQSNYLCLLGKGREAQGKLIAAFDAYMEYGQLNGGREMVPSIDEPGTLARPDVWARGRIAAMISKSQPEVKRPLEERIAKQWEGVKSAGDLEKLRGFVRVFGAMFQAGKQARLALAESLLTSVKEEEQREAALHLYELSANRDDRVLAAQATETLARLMIRKGLMEDAVFYYRKLGVDFADVKVRDGKTGADIHNELITDKRFLPYLEPRRQSWNAKLKGDIVTGPFPNSQQMMGFSFEPEGERLPFFNRHRLVMDTNNPSGNGQWQMRIVDRQSGETVKSFPYLTPNHYILNYSNNGQIQMRFAQVYGHVLLLTLSNMVYAFDLLEQKKLWEYNMLGKTPVNMNVVQTINAADGTMTLVYADGTRQRMGQLGVLEASYVCLPTRDGLVALDPSTGAVLWNKEAAAGSMLFGDPEHVFVIETAADGSPSKTQVVRATDGVSVKVPDFSALFQPGKRLQILGRHMLSLDDDSEGKVLRLYDILTGKDSWSQKFPANSMPVRCDDPSIAGVVDPQGNLTLVDGMKQKVVLKVTDAAERIQAAHLAAVVDIRVYADRERYFVALNRPPEQGVSSIPYVTNGLRSARINGYLYAYDRMNGQVQWWTPESMNTFMLMEQIEDLPILIFTSHHNRFNNRGNEQQQVRVEAIDKRTGKLVFGDRPISPNGQFYTMLTDPKAGVIELLRYDIKVRFAPEGTPAPANGPGVPGNQRGAVPQPFAPAPQVMPAQRIQIQVLPAIQPQRIVPKIAPVPPRPVNKDPKKESEAKPVAK
jgi:outer membrane protein assembly factor BamB/tetratricopeptide (TPR) repeat protein